MAYNADFVNPINIGVVSEKSYMHQFYWYSMSHLRTSFQSVMMSLKIMLAFVFLFKEMMGITLNLELPYS